MVVRFALTVLLLACLMACASPAAVTPTTLASRSVPYAPGWPPCAPAITDAPSFPPQIAPDFPQPPALALTKALVLHEDPSNMELVGFAPLALPEADRWLREQLPPAGYAATQTDAEADEIEGIIVGKGWTG